MAKEDPSAAMPPRKWGERPVAERARIRRVARRAELIFTVGHAAQFRVSAPESFRLAEEFEKELERLHAGFSGEVIE